jgi:uncharacterized protein with beta-barrel porin domain
VPSNIIEDRTGKIVKAAGRAGVLLVLLASSAPVLAQVEPGDPQCEVTGDEAECGGDLSAGVSIIDSDAISSLVVSNLTTDIGGQGISFTRNTGDVAILTEASSFGIVVNSGANGILAQTSGNIAIDNALDISASDLIGGQGGIVARVDADGSMARRSISLTNSGNIAVNEIEERPEDEDDFYVAAIRADIRTDTDVVMVQDGSLEVGSNFALRWRNLDGILVQFFDAGGSIDITNSGTISLAHDRSQAISVRNENFRTAPLLGNLTILNTGTIRNIAQQPGPGDEVRAFDFAGIEVLGGVSGTSGGAFLIENRGLIDFRTPFGNEDFRSSQGIEVAINDGFSGPMARYDIVNSGRIFADVGILVGSQERREEYREDFATVRVRNTGEISNVSVDDNGLFDGGYNILVFGRAYDIENTADLAGLGGIGGIQMEDESTGIFSFDTRFTGRIVNSGSLTSTIQGLAGISSGTLSVENSGDIEVLSGNFPSFQQSGVLQTSGLFVQSLTEAMASNGGSIITNGEQSHAVRLFEYSILDNDARALVIANGADDLEGTIAFTNSGTLLARGADSDGIRVETGIDGIRQTGTNDFRTFFQVGAIRCIDENDGVGRNEYLCNASDDFEANYNPEITVTNAAGATITGGTGDAAGVRFVGLGRNTLDNSGTVTAASGAAIIGGRGDETIRNSGTIDGTVALGAGDDEVVVTPTAIFTAAIDGGDDNDTFRLTGGSGTSGTFDFDDTPLTGFETLIKQGAGSWVLTGDGRNAGGNFGVAAGSLLINGDLRSTMFNVAQGAILGGTGTVGAVNVTGGIFAPGESIGTLIVRGNLSFDANSFYQVEVNDLSESDRVIVFGAVDLGGATLDIIESGAFAGGGSFRYIIIDNDGADDIVGTFGAIQNDFAFLTPTISYSGGDGNDVELTLIPDNSPPPVDDCTRDGRTLICTGDQSDGIAIDDSDDVDALVVRDLTTDVAMTGTNSAIKFVRSTGPVSISADETVTITTMGRGVDGIQGRITSTNSTADLSIVANVDTIRSGGSGIFAINRGSGDSSVTFSGTIVTDQGSGIYLLGSDGGDATVEFTSGLIDQLEDNDPSRLGSAGSGILVDRNLGPGLNTVSIAGDIINRQVNGPGIFVQNIAGGRNLVRQTGGTIRTIADGSPGILAEGVTNSQAGNEIGQLADIMVSGEILTEGARGPATNILFDDDRTQFLDANGILLAAFAINPGDVLNGGTNPTANIEITETGRIFTENSAGIALYTESFTDEDDTFVPIPVDVMLTVAGEIARPGAADLAIDLWDGNDTIVLHATGLVDGSIATGGGSDTVTLPNRTVTGTVDLGAGNDQFNLTALTSTIVTDGGAGMDRAVYATAAGSDDGIDLNDFAFTSIERFLQFGTGTLRINETGSVFDSYQVSVGQVFVNADQSAVDFLVQNFARLGGTGTVGNLTLNTGTLAPGASIGTLTVNGDLVLDAASIFEVEVDDMGNGDLVIVNGSVTLGGATLNVLEVGDFAGDDPFNYLIIDNDGSDAVTGAFGTLSNQFAFLTPSVDYMAGDGNDVALGLTPNGAPPPPPTPTPPPPTPTPPPPPPTPTPPPPPPTPTPPPPTPTPPPPPPPPPAGPLFPTAATTYNQMGSAMRFEDLDRTPGSDANSVYMNLLFSTTGEALAAFDTASGEIYASLLANAGTGGMTRAQRLAARGHEAFAEGWGFWGGVTGSAGEIDTDANASDADADSYGLDIGLDYRGQNNGWALGATVGYLDGGLDIDDRLSRSEYDGWHAGGYGRIGTGGAGVTVTGAFSYTDITANVTRGILVNTLNRTARASVDVETWALTGEARYGFPIGSGWSAGAIASIHHADSELGRVNETGAGALSLTGGDAGDEQTRIGGGLFANWQGERGGLDLSAQYVDGHSNVAQVPFALQGAPTATFPVRSPRTNGAAALMSIAGRYRLGGGWFLGGETRALVGGDENSIAGSVTIGWEF